METVIRVAIAFVVITVAFRVMGKRELSQVSPSEFVMLLLVSEIFQNALIRDDYSMTNALIGVATLFSLTFLNSVLMQRNKKYEQVVEGTPTVIVNNGKMITESMNKERITPGELFNEMRKSGQDELSQVKLAILETDGKITVVPYQQQQSQGRKDKGEEQQVD